MSDVEPRANDNAQGRVYNMLKYRDYFIGTCYEPTKDFLILNIEKLGLNPLDYELEPDMPEVEDAPEPKKGMKRGD